MQNATLRSLTFLCSLSLASFIGCGGDDDGDGGDDGNTTVEFSRAALTTSNPEGRSMDRLIRAGARLDTTEATFTQVGALSSIQSIGLDASGDGYVTFDRFDGTGGIGVYPDLGGASQDASLGGFARVIAGSDTKLTGPKGLFVSDDLGLVLVADFGAMDIKAYALDAEGNAAPRYTIAIGDNRSVWDVHYDATADILWAAGTDGVALAYDDFSASFGAAGPSRMITPTGLGNAKISVNLHGITYDSTLDLLIASDVGDASDATDGQLFVIAAASTADGQTQVTAQVSGSASGLGNPVDIYLQGANLFVAEKSNDTVLRFDDVVSLVGALMTAPDATLSVTKAESVVVAAVGGIGGGAILTTSNPDGSDDDTIVQASFNLDASAATFAQLGPVTSIESVALSSSGDGFLTFDSGAQGGVLFISDLDDADDDGTVADGDRMIRGAATTLVAPKGLDWSDSLVIVADFGAKAITTFDASAEGNVVPKGRTTDLGGDRSVWDVHHDAASDTLFATGTDGTLLVYDSFSSNFGANGPDRMITPAGSVNLHGVAYDADADIVFLTDVGDAAVATDGQIFVIKNARTADGDVTADATVSGSASMLGNPVDCAYDGLRLYVAEKSNDLLLRFDGIATFTGASMTRAPNATTTVVKAESVALVR